MNEQCFVVTSPEDGWDCVRHVFIRTNKYKIKEFLLSKYGEDWEDFYVIHEETLENL